MVSFLPAIPLTWKLLWVSWQKDWKQKEKVTAQLDDCFNKTVPLVSCLMYNLLSFVALEAVIVHYAGFSQRFELFNLYAKIIPCLVGGTAYYCYRFGTAKVVMAGFFSPSSFLAWCQNFLIMQGIALVGMVQSAFLYFLGVYLHRVLLPSAWNMSLAFSTEIYEDFLEVTTKFIFAQLVFCMLATPLWKKGYEISMQAAERGTVTMTYGQILMEVVYQASQSGNVFSPQTQMIVLLTNHFGFRVYPIHIVFAVLEVLLINFAVQFKFCVTHQLMHDVKPLYHMTHIEHHICRGVYPTTGGVGLWEQWCSGQHNLFCGAFGFLSIPFLVLHLGFTGANLVVHTMWPHPRFLQWHTLHHTVLADVYNLNIPSPYDADHSKFVSKLQTRLENISPFVRYEALSDAFSFTLVLLNGLILHYGFGVGIFAVDWSKHVTIEYGTHMK